MIHRSLITATLVALSLLAIMLGVPPTSAAAPQAASAASPALSAAEASIIQSHIQAFLRNEYAWGSEYTVTVGPVTPTLTHDLYQVSVKVSAQGGSDSAIVYVTKDGRYMIRGDLEDLNQDPLAEIRRKLHLDNYASEGPANATVVIVEFADFECPVCRQLDQLLRGILPQYPQVRLVFKDFPLEQIHPWAMTAALAGRCALQKGPEVFWKLHDAIYDNQDLISPENAYSKLSELAQQAGASPDAYQTCMADPKTADAVHQSIDEARSLQVNSTPTTFVDGRRMVGPDASLLKQYLDFALNLHAPQ